MARLHGRDLDILAALVRMRAVRTRDLARLFFTNPSTARKRLRRLFDSGLVRVQVESLAAETRYAASPLGYRLLQESSEQTTPTYFSPPRIDARQAGHHDLLVSFWTALAVGSRRNEVRLEQFRPEWELRSLDAQAPLVPDAIVLLRRNSNPERPLVLAIESDTGSERAHVVQRKLERYDLATGSLQGVFGIRPDAVLFVVSTERRARRLAAFIHERAATPVLLGAVPRILHDGGLTTGISSSRQLVTEPSSASDFTSGLLSGIE